MRIITTDIENVYEAIYKNKNKKKHFKATLDLFSLLGPVIFI